LTWPIVRQTVGTRGQPRHDRKAHQLLGSSEERHAYMPAQYQLPVRGIRFAASRTRHGKGVALGNLAGVCATSCGPLAGPGLSEVLETMG